jgi:hypothetical protein
LRSNRAQLRLRGVEGGELSDVCHLPDSGLHRGK